MPTINISMTVVLVYLSTQFGVDTRPHPSDFSIPNHLRNLVHGYSEAAIPQIIPRAEVGRVASADQPIAITTIFDSFASKPPFTQSTIFDPFAPSEAGRSIPAAPQTLLVTSTTPVTTLYNADFTVCPIPPVGAGYPLLSAQNDTGSRSYSNSSTPVTSSCSTHYSLTVTPICRTTITPLGNFPITITDCKQNVTFSTDHGATLIDNRTLVSKTTKYVARWDSVVTGLPQGVVKAEVCQQNGSCLTYHELWGVGEVMVTLISTRTLDFSAVVAGPSEVVYADFNTIIVAESITTTIAVSSIVEVVTVERSPIIVAATIDPPTPISTSRTTIYSTSTVTVIITLATGTPSTTRPSASAISDG